MKNDIKKIVIHQDNKKRTFNVIEKEGETYKVVCDRCDGVAEFTPEQGKLYCSQCVCLEFFSL